MQKNHSNKQGNLKAIRFGDTQLPHNVFRVVVLQSKYTSWNVCLVNTKCYWKFYISVTALFQHSFIYRKSKRPMQMFEISATSKAVARKLPGILIDTTDLSMSSINIYFDLVL